MTMQYMFDLLVQWESKELYALGTGVKQFAQTAVAGRVVTETLKRTVVRSPLEVSVLKHLAFDCFSITFGNSTIEI